MAEGGEWEEIVGRTGNIEVEKKDAELPCSINDPESGEVENKVKCQGREALMVVNEAGGGQFTNFCT